MSGTAIDHTRLDRLAEQWAAAWTGRADFAECCTGAVAYEDPFAAVPLQGPAALAGHAELLRKLFPDPQVETTAAALERDGKACFPWRLVAVHRGDHGVLPATGRTLALHGVHFVELRDARVHRARGFFDVYDGAVQLGLLPKRGGLGEVALMLLSGFGVRR